MVFGLLRKLKQSRTIKKIKELGGHAKLTDKGKIETPIPKKVENVTISPDTTSFEHATFIAKSVQKVDETPFAEPPDIVMNAETTTSPNVSTYPLPSPEGWSYAYYPAGGDTGKRPNIEAIRTWVENTKVGNASNWSITEEFGEEFGFVGWGFSPEEKKKKIDEVTYKVARKIWYVGRKPSNVTDDEWNEETKHMRPPEGSFNYRNEEKWNDFPYDETYMYRSGYIQ